MVIAHEFAGNRAYNGGMGVYTMLCTKHARESHVVFQFIPFETPPHLSLNHYLTHLQKNSSNPPHTANPPTQPSSSHAFPQSKSPLFLPLLPKPRKSRTAYLTNLTTKKSPSTPSYHPPIHPTPFRTLIFPDPAPFSAFPICPFSKPSIPKPPPPRITSSSPTTHRYPPPSTAAPSTTKPTIPAFRLLTTLTPSPTIQASASVTLTQGIELPHFRLIKANRYQLPPGVVI